MKKVIDISYDTNQTSDQPMYVLGKGKNPFESSSDVDIWVALKEGNRHALAHVYNLYMPHLYRFGGQLTKDKELIKDCIQDVFIAIGSKKESPSEVNAIKSYLFKSLYRRVIGRLKNRSETLDLNTDDGQGFSIHINVETIQINQESITEKLDLVKTEMNNLSNKQRQVILHHFYDGFTYDEIAQVMGLTHKNTVAKLMKRALDSIRKNIVILIAIVSLQTLYPVTKCMIDLFFLIKY